MKALFIALAALVAFNALAQEVSPLYSGAIPNAIAAPDEEALRDPKEPFAFLLNISRPTLAVYLPKKADPNKTAVIILPGGSYRGLSIVKEGSEVAVAFNEMGVAAFLLKYRTPSERHMRDRTNGPLQDVQQALRLVRARAKEWSADPHRVGLVGFSAGGHLAASAATHFDRPVLGGNDNVRPDFLILAYPVISMTDALTHALSRTNLLGDSPSAEAIKNWSLENAVTDQTPPTFLMHAADDRTVNVKNTLLFFEALHAHGIPSELHIYPRGGHGFGLNNATTSDRWIEHCRNWLRSEGWLATRAD